MRGLRTFRSSSAQDAVIQTRCTDGEFRGEPGFPATQHRTGPRVRINERRMKFANAPKFNRKSGEAMAVRTTKITIETEGLLVIRQARTVVTWCPGCQAEVDVVLLGEDTAQLLSGLPTGTLHIWSPPEGPVFICLRSLVQHSQSNDV
jgi:hypothetical protein